MTKNAPSQIFILIVTAVAAFLVSTSPAARADVKLPAIFTEHAVLQRDMAVPVWGFADAGEDVTVTLAGQTQKTKADAKGNWRVTFRALHTGPSVKLEVEGKNHLSVNDLLIGEVWLCSGQSNMEFSLEDSLDGDLEVLSANHPDIRFVQVKEPGSQTPIHDFEGEWEVCTPKTAAGFSAVAYYFALELHEQLNVPIGLIENSWGGSACEAWIPRDKMEGKPLYAGLLAKWDQLAKGVDETKLRAQYVADQDRWAKERAEARATNKPRPPRPEILDNTLFRQRRPANMYNARIRPIMPYGIRGVIWYQGEANAARAYQYRDMFPLMIRTWRENWKEGNFPFYWVNLADFMDEKPQPTESAWAELREAQTMTLDKVRNTGQAVIIDQGEDSDIHPRKKEEVGRRLARLALARDYRLHIIFQSPRYDSMEKRGNKILVKFKDVGDGLRTVDSPLVEGFAIAGEDHKWHWANANIDQPSRPTDKPDTVEISSKAVRDPIAVRYAWADNPVCNLYNMTLLPVTPFRTDDWPGITKDVTVP